MVGENFEGCSGDVVLVFGGLVGVGHGADYQACFWDWEVSVDCSAAGFAAGSADDVSVVVEDNFVAVFESEITFVEFAGEAVGHMFADADEFAPGVLVVFDAESDVAVATAEFAADVGVEAGVVATEHALGDEFAGSGYATGGFLWHLCFSCEVCGRSGAAVQTHCYRRSEYC